MAGTNRTPVLHHKTPLFTFTSKSSTPLLFFKTSFHNSTCFNSLSPSLLSSSSNSSAPSYLHLRSNSWTHVTRVSTAPVEHAPNFNLQEEIARLQRLIQNLSSCGSLGERLRAVSSDPRVKSFFSDSRGNELGGLGLSDYETYLLKCVVAAGQEHVLCHGFGREVVESGEDGTGRSSIKSALYALAEMIENWDGSGGGVGVKSRGLGEAERGELRSLLKMLEEVERFYDCTGGIIGSVLVVSC